MSDKPTPDDAPVPVGDNEPQPVPVPPPPPAANSKDEEPQPVPVPIPPPSPESDDEEPQPVPVPVPPAPKPPEEDLLDPISLIDESEMDPASTKKVGNVSSESMRKTDFKREMNITGTGATRFRVFHSKISEVPLVAMENNINNWMEENQVEVKQASQLVATLEGKRSEENMFIMIWY